MDHCRNANESKPPLESVPAPSGAEEHRASPPGAVRDLDVWADALRQRHLARALESVADECDVEDRAAIADCSRALVDAILRRPRWHLRDADDPERAAAEVFDIEE